MNDSFFPPDPFSLPGLLPADEQLFSNESVKFELYLLTRKLNQLSESMQSIVLLPKKEQKAWVKANESQLTQLLETTAAEVLSVFDGMELSEENLEEAMNCMTQLRYLMDTINTVLHQQGKLQG